MRRLAIYLSLAAIVAGLPSIVEAQQSKTTKASLAGQVLGRDGAPLGGVEVNLLKLTGDEVDGSFPQHVSTTDARGNFVFRVLEAGRYRLRLSARFAKNSDLPCGPAEPSARSSAPWSAHNKNSWLVTVLQTRDGGLVEQVLSDALSLAPDQNRAERVDLRCGPAPVREPSPLDGIWKGKTSQQRKITITVEGGSIVSINFGFSLKLDSPCTKPGSPVATDRMGGETDTTYGIPVRITNGAFSATAEAPDVAARILGKLSGDGASGEIDLQASSSSGCSGKDKVTWNAWRVAPTKKAAPPQTSGCTRRPPGTLTLAGRGRSHIPDQREYRVGQYASRKRRDRKDPEPDQFPLESGV
jgi:hypothetical protein